MSYNFKLILDILELIVKSKNQKKYLKYNLISPVEETIAFSISLKGAIWKKFGKPKFQCNLIVLMSEKFIVMWKV